MLKKQVSDILKKSRAWGWVLEPDAQKIFSLYGFQVPAYGVATTADQAIKLAAKIGYPVAAKIVSPAVIHKSDVKGVVLNIRDDATLVATLLRLQKIDGFAGMLIAEMVKGLELILGAKYDVQFGPMVLVGMGGVGVEIYKDVALRMAPLQARDVDSMLEALTARKLLTGYRGAEPVNLPALKKTMMAFSQLMMDLKDVVESVDLNPVMCSARASLVVDSRIMLKSGAR